MSASWSQSSSRVSSHNEWDPLEEVILGRIELAAVPNWHAYTESTMPESAWGLMKSHGGSHFPDGMIEKAQLELERLEEVLKGQGVIVRRPDTLDHAAAFATPDWRSLGGLYAAMPRDCMLVVGREIIEAPMAWRCRYHEVRSFRGIIKEYFKSGAKWTSAPKPELKDDFYSYDVERTAFNGGYAITEGEPTFDAADFMRCGEDIFAQLSHVTNMFGIDWLRRHLGDAYRVHVLDVDDPHAMHLDATFIPLAPGRVMVNPDRLPRLPPMFDNWEVLVAPRPRCESEDSFSMCSNWISVNTLMLDRKRVLVEETELPLIQAFKSWGFEPVPCTLKNFNKFGGGFHCAILDVRRQGTLERYF